MHPFRHDIWRPLAQGENHRAGRQRDTWRPPESNGANMLLVVLGLAAAVVESTSRQCATSHPNRDGQRRNMSVCEPRGAWTWPAEDRTSSITGQETRATRDPFP